MVSERMVETDDGIHLWTATSGTGPPLVLCHGGPGLWDDLSPVANAVDDLVTVHRWDQRGSGRSTKSGPYTLDRFVADLEKLRKSFGYDQWLLGGHSWGATLALQYAFAHPDRTVALLYVSGVGVGSRWKSAHCAEVKRRLTPEQHQRRETLRDRERDETEEREYRTLSWAPDYADRERAFELAAAEATTPFEINYECNAALNAAVETWDETTLLARCRKLTVPALVIHGEDDPRPIWAVESMVDALPTVELCVLADAGHLPWIEEPEKFREVVRRFLNERICHR